MTTLAAIATTPAPSSDGLQAGSAGDAPNRFSWQDGWRYGLLGFPLAFVALPLYVVLPNFYARNFGVSLAALGGLLLAARLFDAVVDPLLGRWSDRLYTRSRRAVLGWAAVAAFVLWAGFTLLFFPPAGSTGWLLVWAGGCLMLTYPAYSALGIFHQSWGAKLGGNEVMRSRVVAWREGLGLAGVLVAAVAPVAWGLGVTSALLLAGLLAGYWTWARGMQRHLAATPDVLNPVSGSPHAPLTSADSGLLHPFSRPAFRRLFAVFLVNGIASAIPATLLLFFVQDRLQAPATMEPVFLSAYFVSAALAMPLWLRLVRHLGLARSWLAGMALSIATFVFAAQLGAGDAAFFVLVCALSGAALGSDLALPGALLAGSIAASNDGGRSEGSYFGWWNFAGKLNLALAAGLALPVLQWLGYQPGTRDDDALQTLVWAYCLLPCALKAGAGALLYVLIIRKNP